MNVDDKACTYNNFKGDGSCTGGPQRRDAVLVDRAMVATNPGYSVHNSQDGSQTLRGVKVRLTNTIAGGGHYAPPRLQVLDLTAKKLPPDKVLWQFDNVRRYRA